MKKIVVYQSDTGHTKKYAEWIAEKLDCESAQLKGLDLKSLGSFDQVIYGGWIMGNMIVGLDKIRNAEMKSFVVFGVGVTPTSQEVVERIQNQNKLTDIPFYYFEGGLDQEKLGFLKRTMLKTISKSVMKKEEKTADEEFMAKALVTTFDNSNQGSISKLVGDCLQES